MGPGHVREAGLPLVPIWDAVLGGTPFGRGPGILVCLLAANDPMVREDPAGGDLVVSDENSGADLHRRDSETYPNPRTRAALLKLQRGTHEKRVIKLGAGEVFAPKMQHS